MLYVLLYVLLCASPALILLPVRWLDREPDNETIHESGDDEEPDGPDGLLAAA